MHTQDCSPVLRLYVWGTLACAAALATLRVFEEEDILQNVRQQEVGSCKLQEMASKHPDLVAGAEALVFLSALF